MSKVISIILTKEQESTIIDFIKRWGVDSPELVAEMLDHYCEMVTEEMERGRDFQEVVNSWKTKQTLNKLRKIERSYRSGLNKQWRLELWASVKWTFTSKPMFILIPLFLTFFMLSRQGETLYWLSIIVGTKAVGSWLVGWIIISFNKRRNQLDGFRRIGSLISANGMLSLLFFNKLEDFLYASNISPIKALIIACVLLASFVLDFVSYRLFTLKETETAQLTDEILKEYKLPPGV